ncbi:MAG: tRNA (guanosine(46)-N7)-methyltransferase TrmB [Planctomycetota bacterium]
MRLKMRRQLTEEERRLEVTVPELAAARGWGGIFGHRGPIHLEVGIGKDTHILDRAAADPQGLFVGLEYSRKKLNKVLSKAARREGLGNLRVMLADATRILDPLFRDASLCAVYVLFPDPWPKKRHRRKRLIQEGFVRQLAAKMMPGAELEVRTDDADYLQQMVAVLEKEPLLVNHLGSEHFLLEPQDEERHIPTLFEIKFRNTGRPIYYLYYRKEGVSSGVSGRELRS